MDVNVNVPVRANGSVVTGTYVALYQDYLKMVLLAYVQDAAVV